MLKTFPAVFILVLFVAVSLCSAEGTLLCFGKDGHIAVEFVDTCNGSGFGSQVAGIDSDACGPCHDVLFLGSPAYTQNVSYQADALSPFPLSQTSPVLPARDTFNTLITTSSSHHPVLASLRTTVLLI